jgi:hypothetical protein
VVRIDEIWLPDLPGPKRVQNWPKSAAHGEQLATARSAEVPVETLHVFVHGVSTYGQTAGDFFL